MNVKLVATFVVLSQPLLLFQARAPEPLEAELHRGQQQLYSGDFDGADNSFKGAARDYPEHPAPPVLRALLSLWHTYYFGPEQARLIDLRLHVEEGIAKSERLNGEDAKFWRAVARVVGVLGQSRPGIATSRSWLSGMFLGASLMNQIRRSEEELESVPASSAVYADAQITLVALRRCGAVSPNCLNDLWKLVDKPVWFQVDFKYLIANLTYASTSKGQMEAKGVPTAIELHFKYPRNGLFHLALVKLDYEIGDKQDSAQYAGEIIAQRNKYGGSFDLEARYFLAVLAYDQRRCAEAEDHLLPVIRAAPRFPAYLLPWSQARLAQCYAYDAKHEQARTFARSVLAGPNVANVHVVANRVLQQIEVMNTTRKKK